MSRHPWEERNLRDDVLKVYNLRLPEPYLLKLKYIAEHTPGSMHQFCIDALLPAIDKKIAELHQIKGIQFIQFARKGNAINESAGAGDTRRATGAAA